MGVKPDKIPNEHNCDGYAWSPVPQPDKIKVTVSGITLTEAAPPHAKQPPNGVTTLEFVVCPFYDGAFGDWPAGLAVADNHVSFFIEYVETMTTHQAIAYSPLPDVWEGELITLSDWYTAGQVSMELHGSGFHRPDIWQPGIDIGVPTQQGYFAELISQSPVGDCYRYASHFDGTNIKILKDS